LYRPPFLELLASVVEVRYLNLSLFGYDGFCLLQVVCLLFDRVSLFSLQFTLPVDPVTELMAHVMRAEPNGPEPLLTCDSVT